MWPWTRNSKRIQKVENDMTSIKGPEDCDFCGATSLVVGPLHKSRRVGYRERGALRPLWICDYCIQAIMLLARSNQPAKKRQPRRKRAKKK